MNISDILLGSQNSGAISEIARKLGISEEQARNGVGALVPSLSRGMQRRSNEIGVNDILDALGKGNHSKYLDEPERLGRQETIDDGNSILGHIFGSKEVSRNVAKDAASKTGLGSTLMKKMLPIVASMVMASLSKKVLGGGSSTAPSRSKSGGLLTSLLDSDGDGSVIDDVLGMAFKAAFR
jgi:hypothetical protein